MPVSHYEAVRTQLATDIAAAVTGASISFGVPMRERLTMPAVVVLTTRATVVVPAGQGPTHYTERYALQIEIRLPKSGTDSEIETMAAADALIREMTGSVSSDQTEWQGLTAVHHYANVCGPMYIDGVETVATDDTDGFDAVVLSCHCDGIIKQ